LNKQDEFTVEDSCILHCTRVEIPVKYQVAVLFELHLNHPGMVRMKSLARLHVWWPSLDHDVEQTVQDCHACQVNCSKSPLKVSNPWIWPTQPWQRIHVDSSTTASAIIQALRFLFATHGLPEEVVLDNDPNIVAQETNEFLKSNGIRNCLSSPYHSASDGEVEEAVRTFKESMKTMKDEPGTQAEKLACFLLTYRSTPHMPTGCTPAELLMGQRICTGLDIVHPDLSAGMSEKSKLADHTTAHVFLLGDRYSGDPVMKDYQNHKRQWIKGVIQDRLGRVT